MMTKLHKDIAMHMMQCVQSDQYTDSTTIKVTKSLSPVYFELYFTHDKLSPGGV